MVPRVVSLCLLFGMLCTFFSDGCLFICSMVCLFVECSDPATVEPSDTQTEGIKGTKTRQGKVE